MGKQVKGKYFHLDRRTADQWEAWVEAHPWVHQGAFFGALLKLAITASEPELLAILKGKARIVVGRRRTGR